MINPTRGTEYLMIPVSDRCWSNGITIWW